MPDPLFYHGGHPAAPSEALYRLRRRFTPFAALSHVTGVRDAEVDLQELADALWEFSLDLEAAHAAAEEWERREGDHG